MTAQVQQNRPTSANTSLQRAHGQNRAQVEDLLPMVLGSREISIDIPKDAPLTQVEESLQIAITGLRRLNDAEERLKPVIGRILLVVKERKLFKPQYKNFTAYVMGVVVDKMKLGRSTAFDALKIAGAFPSLKMEEYARYGATKLLTAATHVTESDPGWKEVLEQSTGKTTDQYKEHIRSIKLGEATPEARPHVVAVRTNQADAEAWKRLLEEENRPAADVFHDMMSRYVDARLTEARSAEARTPTVTGKGKGKARHAN